MREPGSEQGGQARLRRVALVPVGVPRDRLAETTGALDDLGLPYDVVPTHLLTVGLILLDPVLVVVQCEGATVELLDLVRRLHREQRQEVVLMTRLHEEDELVALEAGALAVMALPMSRRRLRARLRSLHRHLVPPEDGPEVLDVGGVLVDPARREVTVGGAPVPLTRTEFDLLLLLARRPQQVVTRDELIVGAGDGRPVGSYALDSHISRLRSKIRAAGGPRLVEAVRGVGYRLQ